LLRIKLIRLSAVGASTYDCCAPSTLYQTQRSSG
jgi:hypothetical protein